jgi:Xaa-Pro dipeptidase
VGTAREHGVPHYRRQHVGHAIGLEVYDEFGIAPGVTIPLETDMVLCVETPYYEIGWGGVQIEDLVRVTPAGPVRLNKTARDLVRISA